MGEGSRFDFDPHWLRADTNAPETIRAAARKVAQAHGFSGLNFWDLAADVGIISASIDSYFPSKTELGAAVA